MTPIATKKGLEATPKSGIVVKSSERPAGREWEVEKKHCEGGERVKPLAVGSGMMEDFARVVKDDDENSALLIVSAQDRERFTRHLRATCVDKYPNTFFAFAVVLGGSLRSASKRAIDEGSTMTLSLVASFAIRGAKTVNPRLAARGLEKTSAGLTKMDLPEASMAGTKG